MCLARHGRKFWPPNVVRGWTPKQIVEEGRGGEPCGLYYSEHGLYGLPTVVSPDPWAEWEDTYYGGVNIKYASNIVFSNG